MLSTLKNAKGRIGRVIANGLRFPNIKVLAPIQNFVNGCGKKPTGPRITLKVIPASVRLDLSYDDRNMRKGRELSPHLSIYKPQLTSVLSICLRISGCILTVYVWLIGLIGLIFAEDIKDFFERNDESFFDAKVLTALRFIFALPFSYHYLHGTRHLIWYTGAFLTKPQIYGTGYVSITLTLLLAIILTCINGEEEKIEEVEIIIPEKDKKKLKQKAKETVKVQKQDYDSKHVEGKLTTLELNIDDQDVEFSYNDP